jgi:hypothetical protein
MRRPTADSIIELAELNAAFLTAARRWLMSPMGRLA